MTRSKMLAVLTALNTSKVRKAVVVALVALAGVAGLTLNPETAEAVIGAALTVVTVLEGE